MDGLFPDRSSNNINIPNSNNSFSSTVVVVEAEVEPVEDNIYRVLENFRNSTGTLHVLFDVRLQLSFISRCQVAFNVGEYSFNFVVCQNRFPGNRGSTVGGASLQLGCCVETLIKRWRSGHVGTLSHVRKCMGF